MSASPRSCTKRLNMLSLCVKETENYLTIYKMSNKNKKEVDDYT